MSAPHRWADRDTVNRMTELSGVAHIVLRVKDWKRAARWYEQVLGFERRQADGFVCVSLIQVRASR